MPGQFIIFNTATIILQYSLLLLLYYFLYKVIKIIYLDLKQVHQSKETRSTVDLSAAAKLLFLNDTNIVNKVYELREITSIGRKNNNDIVIDENFVSSEHACIEKFKGDYWLTDLNSTNGTYINDCRATKKVLLQTNDVIKIGAAVFRFER